ncbi:hypothetical protein [uncultured Slackia sp.]|jgi:hypothetical protein|uniref:hypothetical protein n=1 Tax=uncultured Slackia sp. TaxID=665903 RepID=UPI0025E217C5|nr:hypothetical protein [uncultured Slackia sp.]
MRMFGMNPGEYLLVMLPIVVFYLAILAIVALVLYWVVRKAVCAGMEDFEKKKAGQQEPRI